MRWAGRLFFRLLHPPRAVLCLVPPLSFAALSVLFLRGDTRDAAAYVIYTLSAYSLVIWVLAAPKQFQRAAEAVRMSGTMRRIKRSAFGGRYLSDLAFRGSVGICQGMAVNFCYVMFHLAVGIRYASVWFLSMAVYYLVLGALRSYLIVCYRRQSPELEQRCYRITAWLLLLLNIPMGGMIVLMIRTDSGYFYPGSVIYLSALYTFYAFILAIVNVMRFRALGSPILSAAKVLNLVSALMSLLGLQTAMIARFSPNGEGYRKLMNTITGSAVYAAVIVIAVYMLRRSRKLEKKGTKS